MSERYLFRTPAGRPQDRGASPPRYRREAGPGGMLIERDVPLAPGEIVPLEIEILPSGTRFGPGEALRLVIQGRDVYRYPRPLIQALHDDSVNRGPHVIHAGGDYDSHLLVPLA